MATVETEFKNWLVEQTSLNKDYMLRKAGENRDHLRLRTGCGVTSMDELINVIKQLKLSYEFCDNYTGSPDYKGNGITVKWGNHKVGLLLAIQKEGRIKRKMFSPKELGLNDYRTNDLVDFRSRIELSLKDNEFYDCLVSMIDNIEFDTAITNLNRIKLTDVNRITSDFGEILCAYKSVKEGNEIYFPKASNNNLADFYENDVPVSAKGRKTGGKVNLSEYKDLISQNTDAGKFLYALATHNRNEFFEYGAKVCKEVAMIAKMVGGTTVEQVQSYVKNTPYNDFYNYIKNAPEHLGLGLPEAKDSRPRDLWNAGSTDPFYFTINTLISRLWGRVNTDSVTKEVSSFLKKAKFVYVDVQGVNIVINEQNFDDVGNWGTVYWSRATKAWHNWMGVEPIKENND
jgi:hypothetical protein